MLRGSGYGLMGVGVLHIVVLGLDAINAVPGWLVGMLWTWEHWGPMAGQRPELVLSGLAFWSTVGSFALPLFILGGVVVWLDRRDMPVPSFVGWGILSWSIFSMLLMPPSGFVLLVAVALALVVGQARQRRSRPTSVKGLPA